MGEPLTNLSFEEWIAFHFDHPVTEPAWYGDIDNDYWDGPPDLTVEYLTRTFQNAVTVLQPYTNAQLKQGLWWLVGGTDYFHCFFDEATPWTLRERGLESIYNLFEQCFALRCLPNHLSHLDRGQEGEPLNTVCYMWWDIIPIHGHPSAPLRSPKAKIDEVCLDVMAQILKLNSDACRESALHGLGHWSLYYENDTTGIIDHFLARERNLAPGLRRYAQQTRSGAIL